MKIVHILNGDSLKEQFPKIIAGDILVARECLVDGDVKSNSLEELFELRATFLSDAYDISAEEYRTQTVLEFEKIKNIPSHTKICLWFEDDLFCQVNFWFVCYLLNQFTENCKTYLIRPEVHSPYGFAALNQHELEQIFEKGKRIDNLDKLASLWSSYKKGDLDQLVNIGEGLRTEFPFISDAIQAHLDRVPTHDNPGRPTLALREIMKELDTVEFAPVFKEFNQRESIYGFGDLQVKRLFEEIINSS